MAGSLDESPATLPNKPRFSSAAPSKPETKPVIICPFPLNFPLNGFAVVPIGVQITLLC